MEIYLQEVIAISAHNTQAMVHNKQPQPPPNTHQDKYLSKCLKTKSYAGLSSL